MARTGRRARWLLLLLLSPWVALAQEVEFHQSADRSEVSTQDTFRLTVVVFGAPASARLELPASGDFEVLSRAQSTEMSYQFGGRIQRREKTVLVLRAHRAGTLTIPPSRLHTADGVLQTEALRLEVREASSPGGARPPATRQAAPDPFADLPAGLPGLRRELLDPDVRIPRGSSDLFLRLDVDRPTAYVGEQVNLSLRIYSRVDLSSVDSMDMPKLDGFWSEDVESPTQLAAEHRVLHGVPYRTYLLKRRALFAMRPGRVEIGPAQVDVTTGFLFAGRRVRRESQPLTLEVKPLPSDGRPDGFLPGNVGRFRLSTELSQSTVAPGEPVTVRVTLEGTGNLRQVALPRLQAPASLRVYDPTSSDQLSSRGGRIVGRKVQEYLVMTQQTGTFELPGLSFAFFNPETGQYESSRTDPLRLFVSAPEVIPGGPPVSSTASEGRNLLPRAASIRPLRHEPRFSAPPVVPWRSALFWPLVLGPLGLLLAAAVGARVRGALRGEDEGTVRRRGTRAARKRLAGAERLREGGSSAAFYGEVEKALLGFLEARLGIPVGGLTREGLDARLAKDGVSPVLRRRIVAILERCDLGRFAPGGEGGSARGQALAGAASVMEEWTI